MAAEPRWKHAARAAILPFDCFSSRNLCLPLFLVVLSVATLESASRSVQGTRNNIRFIDGIIIRAFCSRIFVIQKGSTIVLIQIKNFEGRKFLSTLDDTID